MPSVIQWHTSRTLFALKPQNYKWGRVGGCPETPAVRGFQVADSVRHKFHVLAAHKQMFMDNYRKHTSAVMNCHQTSHNAVLASDFSEYADQDLRWPAVIPHNIEVRLEPLLRGSRTLREGA
jgi:hypothetical protein